MGDRSMTEWLKFFWALAQCVLCGILVSVVCLIIGLVFYAMGAR